MDRLLNPPTLVRVALAAFVLAWLFGPGFLRSAVPIWLVFATAVALELQFFVAGLRATPDREPPDRGPQAVDRERYGYDGWEEADEDGDDDDDELELVPDRPSPVRRLLVGIGVVVALAVVLVVVLWVDSRSGWAGLSAEKREQAAVRFSAEASRLAGKPVTVSCDVSGRHVGAVQHADGAAVVGGDLAYLTPARCLDLYRLAFEHDPPSSRTGRAIAVLAHEASHLGGVGNEATTECYAFQSGVALGRRLGLTESTARRLMRQQLSENALRSGGGFEYRVSSECREGGSLDLDPKETEFP